MKVTPVVYYKKPGYPTGADMKSRPELLKKVPHRWSGNGVVLTALGMSLALCACAARGDMEPGGVKPGNTEPGVGEPEDTGAGGAGQDYRGKTEDGEAHKGLVAPVFIHGEGTGAYGCIAVTAPFFLSEAEAWEIIKSEAESYKGITFSLTSPPVLEDVKLPESRLFSGKTEKK